MSQPINILLVEDMPQDARLVQEALAAQQDIPLEVNLTQAQDLREALTYLPGTIHVVLLDLSLPDSRGIETLRKVRTHAPGTSIVVLTAADDTALGVQAVQAGAQDYLVKGYVQVYPNLLGRAIRHALERARADEQIRQAHAQTQRLLASLPSILIGVDPQGVVTHWNAGAEVMFGVPASAALQHPLSESGVQWDIGKILAQLDTLHGEGPVRLEDVSFRRPDGQEAFLGITIVPVKAKEDQHAELLLFGADITKQKLAESERRRLQDELAQAQRLETIGQFAGGIAHDFNNFLQVILGFAWLIRAKRQDDRQLMGDLQEIVHAAESASGMVKQLLAFSRRQAIQPKLFEINEALQAMGRLLQQFVGQAITLRLDLAPEPLPVKLDLAGLEQIVMNLCSNARDSMRQGGTLTIRTARLLLDDTMLKQHPGAELGEYVRLSIADTGSGMDPTVVSRVFEPFFTTKQLGRGTGLGLAVVYGLVKQHSGWIELATALNQGTTFHLYFPLQPDTVATADSATTVPDSGLASPNGVGPTAKRRILIVDDDSAVRLLCERILQDRYDTTAVSSGVAALELMGRSAYALLLTDIKMPDMDGFELIDRAAKVRPGIKVLAMSGFLTNEMEQRLRAAPLGCQVVRKPFSAAVLQAMVSRCF